MALWLWEDGSSGRALHGAIRARPGNRRLHRIRPIDRRGDRRARFNVGFQVGEFGENRPLQLVVGGGGHKQPHRPNGAGCGQRGEVGRVN
jgi:hypothetical protein